MAISLGGGSSVKAEPNVTPLVDVMLVLLIIFLLLLGLLLSLGSGGRSGLGLLLLLGRRSILESLLSVLNGAEDVLESRLVDDGLEVANDVGELLAEFSIDVDGNGALDQGSDGDVGKGNAFRDEESS